MQREQDSYFVQRTKGTPVVKNVSSWNVMVSSKLLQSCEKHLGKSFWHTRLHFYKKIDSWQIHVPSQQHKYQSKVQKIFKVEIEAAEPQMKSFWYLYCEFWTSLTFCLSVSIIDFEHIVSWVACEQFLKSALLHLAVPTW